MGKIALHIGFLVIFYTAWTTTSRAQTLLETFVFLQNGGFIDIADLKQTSDGRLTEPASPYVSKGAQNAWKIVDRDNCVIKNDTPDLRLSVTYYLNKVIPDSKTDMPRQNVYRLTLYGDQPLVCSVEAGKTTCERTMSFEAYNFDTLRRFKKAIDYIFTNFCKMARPEKPF